MSEPKAVPAGLQDIINYQPDQYFSEEEIFLIKQTFKNNRRLMKVLRKALIPSIADPELPVESFKDDAFGIGLNFEQMPNEQVKSIVMARQDAIRFICGALIKLQIVANLPDENDEKAAQRRAKDSLK